MSCRLNLTVLLIIVFYGDACCSTCFFGICSWAEWKTVSTNCGSSYCSQQRARQICCLDIGWSAQTCSRYCPASGGGGYSQSGNGDSSTLTCNHCSNGGSLQYYGRACDCVPGYYGTCCQYEIYECSSSPCKNGGTCIDKVNGFSCTCPPRLYGTYCETDICQPSVADIVFVLDSSISQTEDQFKQQLQFVEKFIDHIIIGENNLQVGLVTYSTEAHIDIKLNQYQDNDELKEAVRKVQYKPGATFTDKGLRAALKVFRMVSHIRPYDKVARRFVFLLTDGLSTNKAETERAAVAVKAAVDRVLAIGIGQEVSHSELLKIASTDNTNNAGKFVHSVQNFNALYTIVQQLVQLTCDECSWKTSSNIVFLLDTSYSMTNEDFQLGLDSIKYITEQITVTESENNTVDVSLVLYGNKLEVKRALNDQSPKTDFLYQLQTIELAEGSCNIGGDGCPDADLSLALNYTVQNVFDPDTVSTNDRRDFIIVLTNGRQNISETINNEVDFVKGTDKTILVVSLGTAEHIRDLQVLTDNVGLVFTVLDKEMLSVLDVLVSEIFYNTCELTNDFLNND